jgi:hypothetical protein
MEARSSDNKKVRDGTKKKGKGKVSIFNFEGEDLKVLEHREDKEKGDILPSESLVDVQVK